MTNKTCRILITGSRNHPDKNMVERAIHKIVTDHPEYDYVIISGGARGADNHAEQAAQKLKLDLEVYPANWEEYGRKAGIIRNTEMVARGADLCLAFPYGESRGTAHCAVLAHKNGIPVYVVADNKIIPAHLSHWFHKVSKTSTITKTRAPSDSLFDT